MLRIPQASLSSEENDMGKTILIVDDSTSLRQVVGIALKGAGYDVIEGCDGRDALTKLDGRKIHLIISDVNMPNMDGISFVKALKQIPAYKFTPVIMLTTEAGDDKKREGQAAGAKAWVVKPFQPPQMLTAVAKLILP
jgi:two-component system chemotaxis response regulator CheY